MKIKFGLQQSAETSFVTNKEHATFKDFFNNELGFPRISAKKDGPAFTPSFFRSPQRIIENVVATTMIIFDIDQKPEDDVIMLEEMEDALLDLNLEHGIYTSYSNSPECPRYRVVIPASRPIYPEEFAGVAAAVLEDIDEMLDGRLSKVVDGCWKEVSRCYFTFTVHPDRRNGAISFYNPGRPADIDDLKLRESTYAINSAYKPQGPRTGNFAGATGRSMELNRILGGMFRGHTEAEIIERILLTDQTTNAGNQYFKDQQYARNRQRAGESAAQAERRACEAWVKSHLNWLRRKVKGIDTTVVNKKATSKEPMPTHEAMIKIRSIKLQKTKKGGDSALMELQVMSGEHAGRHFWHRFYGKGNHAIAIDISKQIIKKIAEATDTRITELEELTKTEGKILQARIKHKPGTNGFPAQNEIGAIFKQ